MWINFSKFVEMKKKKSNKPKSRVLPGFEKFVKYGYKAKKVTQPVNSKK
jgi:hypothetical protein